MFDEFIDKNRQFSMGGGKILNSLIFLNFCKFFEFLVKIYIKNFHLNRQHIHTANLSDICFQLDFMFAYFN
jgi:hypothetical protein